MFANEICYVVCLIEIAQIFYVLTRGFIKLIFTDNFSFLFQFFFPLRSSDRTRHRCHNLLLAEGDGGPCWERTLG